MRHLLVATLVVALTTLVSCEETTADEGLDAKLRASGAQFYRGAMPFAVDGPEVKSVSLSPIVNAGAVDRSCSGVTTAAATAVALSLEGDLGYWIVPTGLPDLAAPGFPTFATRLSFASTLGAGRTSFIVRAVDGQGRFGAPFVRPLDVTITGRPAGRFVIALGWSNVADLDLHVVDPSGVEIWKRNINSYEPPPPGAPPEPPGSQHIGGVLDFDSNAGCVGDGRRAEHVVYAEKPPSGRYLVRVDAFSLCGEVNAPWRLEAVLDGVTIGRAEGLATRTDADFPHDRGAGVLALELEIP